jgi:hypothetical protein
MAQLLSVLLLSVLLPSLAAAGPDDEPKATWYKGNLHTHTLWSDGNEFPEIVAGWYHEREYNFLVLSDHNILSQGIRWMKVADARKRGGPEVLRDYVRRFGWEWVELRGNDQEQEVRLKPLAELRTLYESPGRFLMIQGEEITDSVNKQPVHINAVYIRELIRPQGGATVVEAIRNNVQAVESQSHRLGRPMIAQLNHPNFYYAVTAEDLSAVAEAGFFEVYNGHPAVHNEGDTLHAGTERLWDIANTLRISQMGATPMYAVAVDDSHHFRGSGDSKPGRGWVMVRSAYLTPEAIVTALRQGDFYASNGIELSTLNYDRQSGRLEIGVKSEPGATYTIEFIGTRKGFDPTSRPVEAPDIDSSRVTRIYSDDVGEVLQSTTGTSAMYQFKGDELYVRAVVRSSLPAAGGVKEGVFQTAWTQPVGWEKHILATDSAPPIGAP